MKYLLFLLLSLSVACNRQAPKAPEPDSASLMSLVENGLRATVHFEDDSSWNIEQRMAHYGVPGVSIAVIQDSKIHWSKTYGVMDKDTKQPVTSTTLFQAGSISKPVAAYGALTMLQSGLLSLDQPVNNYLRTWKIPDNQFTEKKAVTLEHLVSNIGRLSVDGFLGYNIFEEVPNLVQVLDGSKPANSPAIRVDKLPGESFRYSGGGYCVMQQMMIDQAGTSFPEILKVRILNPLQMNHSTYEQPLASDKIESAATGYLPDGSMTKGKRHTYPEMAAAGLWTTAEDLAKFAIDIQLSVAAKRNAVLSTQMVNQMLTPVIDDFIGLGIFIDSKGGEIYFGHGGWDEGFSSEMTAHKDRGYGVVILTNSNHPDFIAELIRSVAQTYNWKNYLPPLYTKMELDLKELDPYFGRYRFSSNQIATIYTDNNRLFIRYPRSPAEELFRIDDNLYVRKEREKLVTFLINSADSLRYLVFLDEGQRDKIEYQYPIMNESEKVPYEWIADGNYDQALKAFQQLYNENASDPDIQESQINVIGYQLLEQNEVDKAIDVFQINVALYPKSSNTYDSLGEAYLKSGNTDLAIKNYAKSLELNPENETARKVLKEQGAL
ncbi:MAG: serine hydrolase [Saprospiraceae bacterium]|nr:serine hydrolase [Saprospiraceae bacterium]